MLRLLSFLSPLKELIVMREDKRCWHKRVEEDHLCLGSAVSWGRLHRGGDIRAGLQEKLTSARTLGGRTFQKEGIASIKGWHLIKHTILGNVR